MLRLENEMKLSLYFFLISLLWGKIAIADYVATGNISGIVCSGFVFKSCPPTRVDAVKGKDGQLYSLARRYSKVSSFNGSRCWIELKSKAAGERYGGYGLLDVIINAFGQTFYQKQKDGSFKKIDVERLMFDCIKID